MTGVTLGKEMFTDLDFDVSLLAEMLEVLVLALTVMQEEASTFYLLAQQSRWQMDMLKWSVHMSIWDA